MKPLIHTSDFTGKIFLPLKDDAYYNSIINASETKLLKETIGNYLYNEIQDALTLNETSGKYEIVELDFPEIYKLVYGTVYTDITGQMLTYTGLIEYLKYQIYYEYLTISQVQNTNLGAGKFNQGKEVEILKPSEAEIEARKKHDESMEWYYEILLYIAINQVVLFGDSGQYQYFLPKKKYLKNIVSVVIEPKIKFEVK